MVGRDPLHATNQAGIAGRVPAQAAAGYDPFTNAVRMTISRLRAKLGDPPVIETVSPVGYRIT